LAAAYAEWRLPENKVRQVSTKLKFGLYLDWIRSTRIVPVNRICRNGYAAVLAFRCRFIFGWHWNSVFR